MNKLHLNDYDKVSISNGCGPANVLDFLPKKLVKWLKPYLNEIFKSCCDAHDVGYWLGVTKAEFIEDNEKFYACMKYQISTEAHWYSKPWFYYKAWQYYHLVKEFGWDSYNSTVIREIADLPSYQPDKDQSIKQQCIWLNGRWWLRSELSKQDIDFYTIQDGGHNGNNIK